METASIVPVFREITLSSQSDPLISIIIVNFQVPHFLSNCIRSLREATLFDNAEVIVVDNASQDDSQKIITSAFPEVRWVGLKTNLGFGKANNLGAREARGEFLLFLNPDTVVSENTLETCIRFMRSHPTAGIMGPKTLNPDGTLQAGCRRSFPTPMVAIWRFCGLSRLFPKSKHFGRYNLTYLDPDSEAMVDAVSGSFMFTPRTLFIELGGFDEQFFMYGEDLDLCRRIRDKGFTVWYNPATTIVHFKGKSSERRSVRSRLAFYNAMILFSRKYRHTRAVFLPGWLIVAGVLLQAAITTLTSLYRSIYACAVDFVIINSILFGMLVARFQYSNLGSPYHGEYNWVMVPLHGFLSFGYLATFGYRGIYAKRGYTLTNVFVSGFIASVIFIAGIYYLPFIAFSRIAFAGAAVLISVLLVFWRLIVSRILRRFKSLIQSSESVCIIGNGPVAVRLVRSIEAARSSKICGILWPLSADVPSEFKGYPVLGALNDVRSILSLNQIDVLLIATAEPWYSMVIGALAGVKPRSITVRWVAPEIMAMSENELPASIPLHDFTVRGSQ